jgi:glycosyltransferase involved in cell wall biosynthesis
VAIETYAQPRGAAHPSAESEGGPAGAKVRVLIVAPAPLNDPRSGGIANFIRGFIRFMPADFEVEILGAAIGDSTYPVRWHRLEVAGRPVRFFPVARAAGARRTGLVPAKVRIVAGILRHRRRIATTGRVLQVHAPATELGLHGRDVPTIRVVHGSPDDLANAAAAHGGSLTSGAVRLAESHTYRNADALFFVDRATHDVYRRGADRPERFHYLVNGVDTSLFYPAFGAARTVARTRVAGELGLDPSRAWLLYAGRLDEQKDPLLLIAAFAEYMRNAPSRPAQLILVGDGRLRSRAEQAAQARGIALDTRFIGAMSPDRLAHVMRAADALAMTSTFEASPFVVVEALASGLPVVSTSVGEVPSVIEHGDTGWIASGRSAVSLSEGIAWALTQDREAIGQRCATAGQRYELSSLLQPLYDEHRRLSRLVPATA